MQRYRLKIKNILYLLSVFFLFSLCFFLLRQVNAQESIPLVISPAKQEVEVVPGQEKTLHIGIFNKSPRPISGFFHVTDFVVSDSQGTPQFVEDGLEYSAKGFITVSPEEITVPPYKGYETTALIQIPDGTKPGGKYAAVYFEPTSSASEGASNISVRIASLINIKVSGAINELANVSFFNTPEFLEFAPVEARFSIVNTGNYHIRPGGEIKLINMFGKTVARSTITASNIFPGSAREYRIKVGKGFLLGPYTTKLTATYEENHQLSKKDTTFIFPWRLFLILVVGLTILYYMVASLRKKEDRRYSSERHSEEDLMALKQKLKKRND